MIAVIIYVSYAILYVHFPQSQENVTSNLEIIEISTKERTVVYSEPNRFEAPNWSNDGTYLLFNKQGKMYRFYFDQPGQLQELVTGFADRCNNDHGISPDGKTLAISHFDKTLKTSIIYTLPIDGGTPRKITPEGPSYWHGWSPDNQHHVFVGLRNDQWDIYKIPATGGSEIRLTDAPGLDDGPEYSPDGQFIYFNSVRTGTMQLWKMKPDGSDPEQLTFDAYNDWFPHVSPDGKTLVFISYLEPSALQTGDVAYHAGRGRRTSGTYPAIRRTGDHKRALLVTRWNTCCFCEL